jgi:tripartite motif-containing protein 71
VTRGHADDILAFSAGGSFPAHWGSEGSDPGQFKRPNGIAVAPDGTVYVVDQGNDRIQAFCVAP